MYKRTIKAQTKQTSSFDLEKVQNWTCFVLKYDKKFRVNFSSIIGLVTCFQEQYQLW